LERQVNGFKVEMDGSTRKYTVVLTRHAKERFSQRFSDGSGADQTENILSVFSRSKETAAFLNKPSLLQHFYDTYGYERKHFYVYRNAVLFVCDKRGGMVVVLTCMRPPLWAAKTQKYRKKVAC
jgi:hypothetical protein